MLASLVLYESVSMPFFSATTSKSGVITIADLWQKPNS